MRRVALAAAVLLYCSAAFAATVTKCVHNSTELQNYLSAATSSSNTNDYILQLRENLFLAPSGGFTYFQNSNHSLDIEGGFFGLNGGTGCDLRFLTPEGTQLDGRGNQSILYIGANGATSGNITLRYLTFQNSGGSEGALRAYISQNTGTLRVTDSLFTGNGSNADNSFTVDLDVEAGTTHFTNNAVVGNTAAQSVVSLQTGASQNVRVYASNNTIAGNTGGGYNLTLHGPAGFDLTNNIILDGCMTIYSDSGEPAPAVTFDSNDIDDFCGTSPTGSGNIDRYPQFVDAENGNYRLTPTSAGVNAGDNTPPGGTRPTDLNGLARIVGRIDMGAYEVPDHIFGDGFEP